MFTLQFIDTTTRPPLPAAISVAVQRYAANARGGFTFADININGATEALWELAGYLGRPFTIFNPIGTPVWRGKFWSLNYATQSYKYKLDLDDFANAIAITYVDKRGTGGGQRKTTTWLQDAQSVAQFGIKELLESSGTAIPSKADAHRATYLKALSYPQPEISVEEGDRRASISARGLYETLSWRYYQYLVGKQSNSFGPTITHPLGYSFTSNQVGFSATDKLIYCADDRLSGLNNNNRIIITGSTSNNQTYTVRSSAGDPPQPYTATTISFVAPDQINDSANGMAIIRSGNITQVSGSASNNGFHRISSANNNQLKTEPAYFQNIVAAGAGASITLKQTQSAGIEQTPVNERPSANATVTVLGIKVAQKFIAIFTGKLGRIAVPVAQVGTCTDNFLIEFWNDTGSGQPNALVATATLLPVQIGDSREYVWADFTTPPQVYVGGAYWIVVRRAGANSYVNYYQIGLSDQLYDVFRFWNGSAWVAGLSDTSLPFQIEMIEDVATQIKRIVQTTGQFYPIFDIPTAFNAFDHPYQKGDQTALDVLEDLLNIGDATGQRLLVESSIEDVFRCYAEPTNPGEDAIRLANDGKLYWPGGAPLEQGVLPVGRWLVIEEARRASSPVFNFGSIFVEEAEFDATRNRLRIRPKGARNKFDLGGIDKG